MGITIVGLGPGNGRLLTREAWQTLTTVETIYLRTKRHPAVADLPNGAVLHSFDHLYDSAEKFGDVYDQIVAELLQLGQSEDVVYAVPGHPFVGEATVTRLVAAAKKINLPMRVVAGLSFVEPALAAVGIDALDGLQIFDALVLSEFLYPPVNSNAPLLLAQVYNRLVAGEVKLLLTAVYPDEHLVTLIHAAGENNQTIEQLHLYEIDRSPQIDHLTSLYVPPLSQASTLPALAETVAVLRGPDGCPWDQEQTPQSMRSGFLEEAYEVVTALDNDDVDNLREELGDLLYHLLFQAQIASERGDFTLTEVIAGIETKLKRRHPHVWGDWEVADTAEVLRNWELLKMREKVDKPDSILDNIPSALPALARSQKIQDKVSEVNFDWPDISGVWNKLQEEIDELKDAKSSEEKMSELGDILFVLVNLGRWLKLDAETALREANSRFSKRFNLVEQMVETRKLDWNDVDLPVIDLLWREAKELLANDDAPVKVEGIS